jgi:hypothetical protein
MIPSGWQPTEAGGDRMEPSPHIHGHYERQPAMHIGTLSRSPNHPYSAMDLLAGQRKQRRRMFQLE